MYSIKFNPEKATAHRYRIEKITRGLFGTIKKEWVLSSGPHGRYPKSFSTQEEAEGYMNNLIKGNQIANERRVSKYNKDDYWTTPETKLRLLDEE